MVTTIVPLAKLVARQALDDDPDFFLGRELTAGLTLDLPGNRWEGKENCVNLLE
jgi:hypothetical protein